MVLASAAEHDKAVTYLMEKVHGLNKLSSDIGSSTVGPEFNVNE